MVSGPGGIFWQEIRDPTFVWPMATAGSPWRTPPSALRETADTAERMQLALHRGLPLKVQCDPAECWACWVRSANTFSTPKRGSAATAKRTTMKTTIKLNLKNLNLDLFSYCTYIWLLLKNVFNLYPDIDKKEKLKKNFIIAFLTPSLSCHNTPNRFFTI